MSVDKAKMLKIIEHSEGNVPAPYYDSVGLISIGLGFNIEEVSKFREKLFINLGLVDTYVDTNGNIRAKYDSLGNLKSKTLYEIVDGAEVENTKATDKLEIYFDSALALIKDDAYEALDEKPKAQTLILQTKLNAIMIGIQNEPLLSNYKSNIRTTFTLTSGEIRTIFYEEIESYDATVKNFLNSIPGDNKLEILDSTDAYHTLVSLAYNNIKLSNSSDGTPSLYL